MQLDYLKDWLKGAGFSFSSNQFHSHPNECGWYAYRKTQLDARECECNDRKRMQLIVYPSVFAMHGTTHKSVEIEVCGQYGRWWKFTSYGHSFEEFCADLHQIEAGLIRAWNALAIPEEKS